MTRVGVILVLALSACATEQSSELGIFTVAVVGREVFVGRSRTYGTSGNFRMQSLAEDPIQCRGQFRYLAPPQGRASFSCSNGESGSLKIRAEGNYIGSGEGTSSMGPVRLLFGYSLWKVNHRIMPAGKKLVATDEGIELVDVESAK